MDRIYIFPNLDDEVPELVCNQHSARLLAAYQALVDAGIFKVIIVNELPVDLVKKLYPSVAPHLNLETHKQTSGTTIKPEKKNDG